MAQADFSPSQQIDQAATSSSESTPKQNSNHPTSSETRDIVGTEAGNDVPVSQSGLTDHSSTLPGVINKKRSRLNWHKLQKFWRCVQGWPQRKWQRRSHSRKDKTVAHVKRSSKSGLTSNTNRSTLDNEANDSHKLSRLDTTTDESSGPTPNATSAKDQAHDSFPGYNLPPDGSAATSAPRISEPDSRGRDGGSVAALRDEKRVQYSHGPASHDSVEGASRIPSVRDLGPDPSAPGQKPVDRTKCVYFQTQGEVANITSKIMRRMFLDGGSDANLMVQSVQEAIGAKLTRCTRQITWGETHVIRHIGEVEVNWYFANQCATYTTTFVVIPGPAWFDTLVGDETITKHKFFIENDRVLAVRGECDDGVGFDDE